MSRIISGRAKGRRLATAGHNRTRPTSDRVREALFSSLGSWFDTFGDDALAGLSFLDLYAGSGGVGLEAASRGAEPVLLVEADHRTAEIIRANARTTGLKVLVRAGKVDQILGTLRPRAFDIVWLDPPYDLRSETLNAVLGRLRDGGWITAGGLLVVERSARSTPPSWPGAVTEWSRRYGETTLYFAELEERP